LAELEFHRGARVVIEGPATFETRSDNSGALQVGKLVARVPSAAVGFAVQTEAATVIDLGTEFAVSADGHGQTEVEVIEGKIEIQPSAKDGTSSPAQQPITLTAGSARRIALASPGGEATIREIPVNPSGFSRYFRPAGPIRLPIQGVMASSEFGVRRAKHLIDGSGLSEERHSIDPDGAMWHSALGRVKGEFVLFDLGRSRRLHSLKVWNYNEARHEGFPNDLYNSRGVGQANIYVSTFGRGDPFSQPKEWRLVVDDRKFAAADGTSDYATPEVIPLNNVEARFVAIVVDDHLGPDSRPPVPLQSQEVVGLSEVQIFGERISQSRRLPSE